MKKTFIVLAALITAFNFIACSNSFSESNPENIPEEKVITVSQLFSDIPTSIEEFESKSKSQRSARSATTVDFESVDGILLHGYKNLCALDFSMLDMFMTILKYDLIKTELQFDTITDISSIIPDSLEFTNMMKKLNTTFEENFWDLGKIKVSYNNNIVNIYWILDVKLGDFPGEHSRMVVYIQGSYENDAYNDFFCSMDYGTLEFESYKRDGNVCTLEVSFYSLDGASEKTLLKKNGSEFVSYGIGSSELASNPSDEILESASKCRWIRFKDSKGAAEFKNGKSAPEWNLYEIYDTDGSLIFSQDKRNDQWRDDTTFKQTIPLKYLRSSKTVQRKEDGKYYFEDNNQKIEAIEDISFETGSFVHENFPCYTMQSESASKIELPEPFSFTKKDYTLNAISRLNAYVAESYTEDFSKALVSQSKINELKSKIQEWIAEVSN